MLKFIIPVLLYVFFLSQPTQAQQKEDRRPDYNKCGDGSYRAIFIGRAQKSYAHIIAPIERVPPGEAKFLREEIEESIFASDGKGRFLMAHSNRYYYPLQVHDAYEELRNALNKAMDATSPKDHVKYLFSASMYVIDLNSRISDYISFDETRSPRVIPLEKVGDLFFYLFTARRQLELAFLCAISQWHILSDADEFK